MSAFTNLHTRGLVEFMSKDTNITVPLLSIDGTLNSIEAQNIDISGSFVSNSNSLFSGTASFKDNTNSNILAVDPINSYVASTNFNIQNKLLVNDLNVETSKVLFNALNTSTTQQATSIICNCVRDTEKHYYTNMSYSSGSYILSGTQTLVTNPLVADDFVILVNQSNAADINNGLYIVASADATTVTLKNSQVSEVEKITFDSTISASYDIYPVYIHHLLFKEADSIKYGYSNNATTLLGKYFDLIQSSGSYIEHANPTGTINIEKSVTEFTGTPTAPTISLPDPETTKSFTFQVINKTTGTITVSNSSVSFTANIPADTVMKFMSGKDYWYVV